MADESEAIDGDERCKISWLQVTWLSIWASWIQIPDAKQLGRSCWCFLLPHAKERRSSDTASRQLYTSRQLLSWHYQKNVDDRHKTKGSHTNCCIRLTGIHGSEGCHHRHSSSTSHFAHRTYRTQSTYTVPTSTNQHPLPLPPNSTREIQRDTSSPPPSPTSISTLPLERIGVEQYGVQAHLARHLPDDGIIFIHSFSGSRVRLPLRAPKCFIFAPSSSNISSGTSWHDATIFLASNVYIYTFYWASGWFFV